MISLPSTLPLKLGVLAPLSVPGWTEAGEHLLAGIRLATDWINEAGGVRGRPLSLQVRDTAGRPDVAEAAMRDLDRLGVIAVVGEFHSVSACAAAECAVALELPFLCSSAVIDSLLERPSDWVARLAPPQSHGWSLFAAHLTGLGHGHAAALLQPGRYWNAGADILEAHLVASGGSLTRMDVETLSGGEVASLLAGSGATAALLLTGYPRPAIEFARSIRRDPRLEGVQLAAPAGQPEFPEWVRSLGSVGSGVPFLRYRPERLGPLGRNVQASLRRRLAVEPSFVALEGFDAVTCMADLLRSGRPERAAVAAAWGRIVSQGCRGTVRFQREGGAAVWQAVGIPIQIVDREPSAPDRFRTLISGIA